MTTRGQEAGRPPSLEDIVAFRVGDHLPDPVVQALLPGFHAVFGLKAAEALIQHIREKDPSHPFGPLLERMGLKVTTTGAENIPTRGSALIVSNHPTGAPDGVAIWAALRGHRDDVSFISSIEALSFFPEAQQYFVPVELDPMRKTAKSQVGSLAALKSAVKRGRLIVVTPAARICERAFAVEPVWTPGFLQIARLFGLPIIPLHIRASNSNRYYWAGKISKQLQELLVFREAMNKRGASFDITISSERFFVEKDADLDGLCEQVRLATFGLAGR